MSNEKLTRWEYDRAREERKTFEEWQKQDEEFEKECEKHDTIAFKIILAAISLAVTIILMKGSGII